VESKTLDAESELKRFFGAKVVASAAQSESTRQSRQTKLFNNYIAKIRTVLLPQPKATWPIQSGFGGMSMRQLSPEEVMDLIQRRGDTGGLREGERWYSFEQDAGWRQVHTQFLGAVRSHGKFRMFVLVGFPKRAEKMQYDVRSQRIASTIERL
jgi:hypothetical protein